MSIEYTKYRLFGFLVPRRSRLSLRYRNANTSAMALLRKKTGYGLANIRKALELNENDVVKAEKWLQEQAKALGWSKASKVQERATAQGLIGVAVENKKVAMVEVNCETDFVSRNEKFKSLVELVTKTCLQQTILTPGLDTKKVYFNKDELKQLKADNCSLADHVALLIGSVGENTVIQRAFCYETSRSDVEVAVSVHPHTQNSGILLGKYGSFISYQKNSEASLESNPEKIATDICTHIIGMNPEKIGEYGKDEPLENVSEETVLIHQDFLLNDSVTVGQLLTDCGMTILDFKRFQCGESIQNETSKECDSEEQSSKANA